MSMGTRVYRQRGYGLGSVLGGFLKKGLVSLGKTALKTGLQTMDRVKKGENWKEALKSSAKNELGNAALEGAQSLMGSINKSRKRKSAISNKTANRAGIPPKKKKQNKSTKKSKKIYL